MPAGAVGIAAVEAAKEQPSLRRAKTPCRVGKKQFPGVCLAAPDVAGKVREPAENKNC